MSKIQQHPLNSSKSKQLYSFSKAQRFREKPLPTCSVSFYEINDSLFKKKNAPSFGLGNKTDFTKLSTQTPAPTAYVKEKPLSDKAHFSKSENYFGSGRTQKLRRDNIPPPGSYSPLNQTFSTVAFTIRPKLEPKIDSITPGPGKYNLELKPSVKGVFLNVKASRTSRPQQSSPGPQAYTHQSSFSPLSKSSVYETSKSTYFGNEKRFVQSKSIHPGPGTYQIPGDFGVY